MFNPGAGFRHHQYPMARHLIIQLARFGDLIQTKRLILSVSSRPEDEVHLAVDVSLVALAEKVYPGTIVHGIRAHATGVSAAAVFADNYPVFAALTEMDFSSVYNLNYSGLSLAVAGLFAPELVRGYSLHKGQPRRSPWVRMGFRWMKDRRFAPMNLVDFWAFLFPHPVTPEAVNPPALRCEVKRIAVVVSGREARRSLPPEVLAPLVDAVFTGQGGPEIVLLGGRDERPFARKFCRLLRPAIMQKVDDVCGRTQLEDLLDIMSGCDHILTPDTGLMHLAAHLGVPVTAFFLSSAWCFETGPYGMGHTIFQATQTCTPCVESRPCSFGTACLAPFADTRLALALCGKFHTELPTGIVKLSTAFDSLGCDYVPGSPADEKQLPELASRSSLRMLLAEWACCPIPGNTGRSWAKTIFHENDWVLPLPPH